MKKTEVLKILKKLAPVFKGIPSGVEALSTLEGLIPSLPEHIQVPHSKVLNWSDHFELPPEMKNQGRVFGVFADGACRGNPGPGSWGVMIQNEKAEIVFKSSGVDVPTTNNKMELSGVIQGLKGLIDKWIEDGISDSETPVYIYSDSKYVTEGVTSWIAGWKNRGWKKADGKEPENISLWRELDSLNSKFSKVNYIWVKGHAGHPQNEMCDQMCNQALDEAGF